MNSNSGEDDVDRLKREKRACLPVSNVNVVNVVLKLFNPFCFFPFFIRIKIEIACTAHHVINCVEEGHHGTTYRMDIIR